MKHSALSEFCNLNMGQSPDSSTYNNQGEGLPFYQGNADFGIIHPTTRVWCSSPVKIAHAEDILISVRAPIGAMNIAAEECCIGRGLAALTPKQDVCSQKYLYYALESRVDLLVSKGTGSTFKAISKKILEETELPAYPMQKQKEIVHVLETVDSLIGQRHTEAEYLDQLVKSRFVELFGDPVSNPMGWMRKTLQQLVTVEPQNGLYKPQSDYVQDETGIPILRIDAFYDGKVTDFKNLKRLVCSDAEKERYLLKENDIVINRVNSIEYLGKCAHITGMHEDTVFESNMMRFHLDEEQTDAVFITHLLCSKYIYNQILRTAKKAVNQASINQKDVLGFEVYVPPLELQQQFTTFVAEVDKSKHSCELEVAA